MIASLGEERAGLCASHEFVYFARVNFCPFSLPLGVRDWLRLVALPGHFYYLFFILLSSSAVKVQLSQAEGKVNKMSVRISLTLEASRR